MNLIGFTGLEECQKCLFLQFSRGARCRWATSSSCGCSSFILQSASTSPAPASTAIMKNEVSFVSFVWSSSTMIESSSPQVETLLIQQKMWELKYTFSVSQTCFGQGRAAKLDLNQMLSHLYYDVSVRSQDAKTQESSTAALICQHRQKKAKTDLNFGQDGWTPPKKKN